MKLSMSMLAWYLREHHPVRHIVDDDISIEGMRFVVDDSVQMMPEYLYFGKANLFFSSPQYEGAYLAVNRHSMLLFLDSDDNTLLNAILSAFEFFNRMEGRLLGAASSHAPLKTFVEIMEPILENPFRIANADWSYQEVTDVTGHNVDPWWGLLTPNDTFSHPALYAPYYDDSGVRIHDLSERPRIVRNVYEGGAPVIMLYLQKEGEFVGCTAVLQEFPELTAQNMQLLPILAKYCVHAAEFNEATGALQSAASIFQNLLEGKDVGTLNMQRLMGQMEPGPWRLLQLNLRDRTDRMAKKALLHTLRKESHLYFPVLLEGFIYTLIGQSEFQNCVQERSNTLRINGACIGASMPFADLSRLSIRRQQTAFALEQSGNALGFYPCEDYACSYLLRSFRAMEMTPSLLHPALDTLKQYDQDNQGELRKTLSVYLQNERNQLLSAQALHIHPNTLRYRIQRITEITGISLEDPEELKYLRLSDWLE